MGIERRFLFPFPGEHSPLALDPSWGSGGKTYLLMKLEVLINGIHIKISAELKLYFVV